MRGTIAKRLRRQAHQRNAELGLENELLSIPRKIVTITEDGEQKQVARAQQFMYTGYWRIYRYLKNAWHSGIRR